MRNGAHLIWIGLLVCCLVDIGASMEFTGAEGQWARFPMWNACCESEMSFNMKTKSAHGLLVYFDDEGFCDFLELLIHNGRLSLRFSIFCAEPATVLSDTAVNDSRWHAVTLRRNFKNTTLVVDEEIKWVEVKSKRRDMTVFSHLFLGGIPPELRSVALRLTSSAIKDQVPYKGWITNLRVNGSEPVLIASDGINSDICEADHVCMNGGVCSIVNDEPICDCSETGFQGKDCSEVPQGQCMLYPVRSWRLQQAYYITRLDYCCVMEKFAELRDREHVCRSQAEKGGMRIKYVLSLRTSTPSFSRQAVVVITFFSKGGVGLSAGEAVRAAKKNTERPDLYANHTLLIASGAAVLFVKGCMSVGVTLCSPPCLHRPVLESGRACVGHPQPLSPLPCQIQGSMQGQQLKEAVSSMKACMLLALCELCSAKERLRDPDLPWRSRCGKSWVLILLKMLKAQDDKTHGNHGNPQDWATFQSACFLINVSFFLFTPRPPLQKRPM
ncbi:hypothetical protein DNTS_003219 [Danionella cerebrum]|uniref:EGF-like domain-containing protein n=1 Tax=Danionella cerebrum TaxID=2873325 RepID=A0A553QDA9_9TELE|nr:hypothetical protein DNTS_003219 [Danionella translucida]